MTPPPETSPKTLDIRKLVWIVALLILCLIALLFRSMSDPNEIIGNRLFRVDAGLFARGIDLLAAVLLGSVAAAILIWFFEIDFKIEAEDSRFLKRITTSIAGSGGVVILFICATYWVLWDSRQESEEIGPKLAISGLFFHKQTAAEDAKRALDNQGRLEAKIGVQQELLQLALGSGTAKLRLDLDFFCKWWDTEAEDYVGRRVDNVMFTNKRASDPKGPSAMIVAKDQDYVIYMKGTGRDKRIADISFKVNEQNGNPVIVVGVTKGFQEICSTDPIENFPDDGTEPPPAPLN